MLKHYSTVTSKLHALEMQIITLIVICISTIYSTSVYPIIRENPLSSVDFALIPPILGPVNLFLNGIVHL
jgi:hypothetical protein